jgi:hypothetical protein
MQSLLTRRNAFVDHIELWLSGAGLVVILGVPYLVAPAPGTFWQVAAITAIGVGLLHGLIFWVIRRRQRVVRQQSIEEIREMLGDVVKNKLSVIDMYLPADDGQDVVEAQLDGIRETIEQISVHVDTLSEESIKDWKTKYDGAVRRTTSLDPA